MLKLALVLGCLLSLALAQPVSVTFSNLISILFFSYRDKSILIAK